MADESEGFVEDVKAVLGAGWPRVKLASVVGVTEGTVRNWESGTCLPHRLFREAVARLAARLRKRRK